MLCDHALREWETGVYIYTRFISLLRKEREYLCVCVCVCVCVCECCDGDATRCGVDREEETRVH